MESRESGPYYWLGRRAELPSLLSRKCDELQCWEAGTIVAREAGRSRCPERQKFARRDRSEQIDFRPRKVIEFLIALAFMDQTKSFLRNQSWVGVSLCWSLCVCPSSWTIKSFDWPEGTSRLTQRLFFLSCPGRPGSILVVKDPRLDSIESVKAIRG
jgi:hypothetical protein